MMTSQTTSMPSACFSPRAVTTSWDDPGDLAVDIPVSQLIGQVYAAVPAAEQSRLLEHLLKPLSLLSLVAVANGVFANMHFRSGTQIAQIRQEDAQNVRIDDVIALVDHVQQVNVESVESLAQMLTVYSMMAGSAAALLLVPVLLQRTKSRQANLDT